MSLVDEVHALALRLSEEINTIRAEAKYVHSQDVPAATWTITHTLPFYPSVTTIDSSGRVVEGGIQYISSGIIEVTFSSAFSGKAYLS